MSRPRLVLLCVVAALGVTASTAASASAAGQWWVSGAKFSGTEEVTAHLKTGTKLVLTSKLPGGEESVIEAQKISLKKGDIFANNKDLAEEITFLETKIAEPAGCSIAASVVLKPVVSELVVEVVEGKTKVFDLITPKTGTEFTAWTLTGCASEGKYKITGQMRCEVQEPEVEAVDKLCLFSAATVGGVGLKFGTEPVILTAEPEFLLVKKQKWSAKTS
jgi:hypothetical protein